MSSEASHWARKQSWAVLAAGAMRRVQSLPSATDGDLQVLSVTCRFILTVTFQEMPKAVMQEALPTQGTT